MFFAHGRKRVIQSLHTYDHRKSESLKDCLGMRKCPRARAVSALVFLEINGLTDHDYDAAMLLQAMLYLADGQMDGKLLRSSFEMRFLESREHGRMNQGLVELP
jgi:hypothetical protein